MSSDDEEQLDQHAFDGDDDVDLDFDGVSIPGAVEGDGDDSSVSFPTPTDGGDSESVNDDGAGSGGDEYSEIDTRGFGDEDPATVEPEVDPGSVELDGIVDETITSTFTIDAAAEFRESDREEVQDVTGPDPDTPPSPEHVASLHVRVIDTWIDEGGEYSEARGSITVADRTGATSVSLGSHRDVIETVQEDVERGDDVLITGLVGSRERAKYAASAVTSVHVVESDEYPAGYYLNEESELDRLRSVFEESDTQPVAHNRVADIIVNEFDVMVPYTDADDPVWWMYHSDGEHEGLWLPHGRQRLETVLGEKLPYDVNSGRHRREILRNVKVRVRVEPDEFASGAPADEDLQWVLGVSNGVVDLRTGELHDHGPEWRLSAKLPVAYRPGEYDGTLGDGLDWFLDDVCGSEEDRRMCMAMAAHSLMRNHQIKSAFPVLGPSNSGKTKWHGVIKRLLGAGNVHTMDFDSFASGDGFESGKVLGAHAVLDDDASDTKVNDLNFFKKVTGGESVSINQKYEKLADYVPFATVSWLSNDPAVLGTRDSGVKSRIYPIVMPYRHTENPDDGHKDFIDAAELETRIYADAELEALLVAAVEKAQQMHATGKVESERTEKERWELYDSWADSVKRYFRECTTKATDTVIPKSAVYETYKRWCDAEGLDPMANQNFWRTARRSGPFMEVDGVWYSSNSRGVKHIDLGPDGLDYAPDPVVEKLDTTGDQSPDSVTSIRDLHPYRGPSFVTVKGAVQFGDPYEAGFIVDDGTDAVRVSMGGGERGIKEKVEEGSAPELDEGDTVRLTRFARERNENGQLCLTYELGYSDVTVLSTQSGAEDQTALTGDDNGSGTVNDSLRPVRVESDEHMPVTFAVEEAQRVRAASPEESVEDLAAEIDRVASDRVLDAIRAVRDQDDAGDTVNGNDDEDGDNTLRDVRDVVIDAVAAKGDSDGGGADRSVVTGRVAGSNDVAPDKVEHVIDTLLQKGDLYEPSEGKIRVS